MDKESVYVCVCVWGGGGGGGGRLLGVDLKEAADEDVFCSQGEWCGLLLFLYK